MATSKKLASLQAARLFAPASYSQSWMGGVTPLSTYAGMPTYPMAFPGWDDRLPPTPDRPLAPIDKQKLSVMNPWFYGNVNGVGKEFASLNLQIMKLDGENLEPVPAHPLEKLWAKPNPYMGKAFIAKFWTLQMYMPGSGKAFLMFSPRMDGGKVALDTNGLPIIDEIWPIPSYMMRAVGDETNFISHYEFNTGQLNSATIIPPDFICYTRFPHPFDLRDGYSPVEAAVNELRGDQAMQLFNNKFFSTNNGTPTTVVTMKPDVPIPDFNRIKEQVAEDFKNRTILFTRSGDLDIANIGSNLKDMMFDDLRFLNEKVINRAFGIPEGYWAKESNRNNSEHADEVMLSIAWENGVMLTDALNTSIVPYYAKEGETLMASFEDIRPRNFENEDREFTRRMGYWTIGELREADPPPDLTTGIKPLDVLPDPVLLKKFPDEIKATPLTPNGNIAPTGTQGNPALAPGAKPEDKGTGAVQAKPLGLPSGSADDETDDATKAELYRWQTKSIKRLKAGKTAFCGFESDTIPDGLRARIESGLSAAKSIEDVRALFAGRTVDAVKSVKYTDGYDVNDIRGLLQEVKALQQYGETSATPAPSFSLSFPNQLPLEIPTPVVHITQDMTPIADALLEMARTVAALANLPAPAVSVAGPDMGALVKVVNEAVEKLAGKPDDVINVTVPPVDMGPIRDALLELKEVLAAAKPEPVTPPAMPRNFVVTRDANKNITGIQVR